MKGYIVFDAFDGDYAILLNDGETFYDEDTIRKDPDLTRRQAIVMTMRDGDPDFKNIKTKLVATEKGNIFRVYLDCYSVEKI